MPAYFDSLFNVVLNDLQLFNYHPCNSLRNFKTQCLRRLYPGPDVSPQFTAGTLLDLIWIQVPDYLHYLI